MHTEGKYAPEKPQSGIYALEYVQQSTPAVTTCFATADDVIARATPLILERHNALHGTALKTEDDAKNLLLERMRAPIWKTNPDHFESEQVSGVPHPLILPNNGPSEKVPSLVPYSFFGNLNFQLPQSEDDKLLLDCLQEALHSIKDEGVLLQDDDIVLINDALVHHGAGKILALQEGKKHAYKRIMHVTATLPDPSFPEDIDLSPAHAVSASSLKPVGKQNEPLDKTARAL